MLGVDYSTLNHSERIRRIGFDELDSPFPFILSLEQFHTERLLAEHLAGFNVPVERGVQFVGLHQDAAGVTAALHSAGGQVTHVRVPYLVGCDGAHSAVRHALSLPLEGSDYPTDFIIADVRLQWSLAMDEAYYFIAPDHALFVGPLAGGRALVVCDLGESADAAHGDPTLEQVQALMDVCGPPATVLREPRWLAHYRCHRRIVPQYQVGRVFLAGDSAHATTSVGGQGMNTGMQDAFNLGWKLALVAAGAAHPTLLDSYHPERFGVGQAVLAFTDRAHQAYYLRHPSLTERLQRKVLAHLMTWEVVQQRYCRTAAELNVNYRASPLVAEHRTRPRLLPGRDNDHPGLRGWHDFGAAPHAGDRAVDIATLLDPAGNAVRLFQVLRGTGHHLFLLEGVDSDAADLVHGLAGRITQDFGRHVKCHLVVRQSPARPWEANGLVLLDAHGEMHHRYGARGACLYLIRPDGYIGYRSLPPDGKLLEKHLKTLFVQGKAGWAAGHIERLRQGESVEFRPHGHSMQGRIEPGQCCTVAPVGETSLGVGDIVLCEVRGKQCLHLIAAIDGRRYQIADARGTINGWTDRNKIYGKCVAAR